MKMLVRKTVWITLLSGFFLVSQAQTNTRRVFAPLEEKSERKLETETKTQDNQPTEQSEQRKLFAPLAIDKTPQQQPIRDMTKDNDVRRTESSLISYERKKVFFDVGIGAFPLYPKKYNPKTFGGLHVDVGFYVNPHHRISLGAGVYGYTDEIDRDNAMEELYLYPITASWDYLYFIVPRFKIRFGVSAGIAPLTTYYEDTIGNHTFTDEQTETLALIGGGVGLQCDVARKCIIDIGLRSYVIPNTFLDYMELKPIALHFTMTFGWRF